MHAASLNGKRFSTIPPLQFYPTNPLCLSDGNTTDRELTGDRAVGIHCGHQLTASAGNDTAVREPCSLKEELRRDRCKLCAKTILELKLWIAAVITYRYDQVLSPQYKGLILWSQSFMKVVPAITSQGRQETRAG